MEINKYVLTAIILGFLVSWIPRIIPFILVQYKGLPPKVLTFLQYLPYSILFALTLSSLMQEKVGQLPRFHPLESIAVFPTLWIAYKSKNLLYSVLVGVLSIALLRVLVY